MMNMKHTPAPWHHSPELSRTGCELVYADDKHLVANVGSFSRSDETNRANARLIAAAPELLEALTNLWGVCEANGYEVPTGYRNQVFGAIAKATGRAA